MNKTSAASKNRPGLLLFLIMWLFFSPLQPLYAHSSQASENNTSIHSSIDSSIKNSFDRDKATHCQSQSNNDDQNAVVSDCENCNHCATFLPFLPSSQHQATSSLYSIVYSVNSELNLPIDLPPPRTVYPH